MNFKPLVTIGLVTYNRIDLLTEAVQSVLRQTYGDFRLIISNDCPEVPVTFEKMGIQCDPRVIIHNHEQNMGENNNLNFVLGNTDTEWFTWLCDDDVFHPEFLENTIRALDHDDRSSVVAVFTDFASGPNVSNDYYEALPCYSIKRYNSTDFLMMYLNRRMRIVGCYGLMKTKALKENSGMPLLGKGFSPYSDTVLPILLTQQGSIVWLDSLQVFLRTHNESLSASSIEFEAYTSAEFDCMKLLRRILKSDTNSVDESDCIYAMVCWFIDDEITVLTRDKSKSLLLALFVFWCYQLSINYPRVRKRDWPKLTLYIARISVTRILNFCRNKFRL